jgi:predicted HicB family RNase H-like nuclease
MELTPYLEGLQRDLASAAAVGGPDVQRAADLLGTAIEASGRLFLLEALSDAAAEITSKLGSSTVEVRLRGREAQFVVSEVAAAPAAATTTPTEPEGDITRITLRLPEGLKDAVEAAAAALSVSVNAWLVRAITSAVAGIPTDPGGRQHRSGRRYTGYAQA